MRVLQCFQSTFLLLILPQSITLGSPTLSSLKLVQVIFRHGQRTPVAETAYPNDPYKEKIYDEGVGELTNPGKLGEYNIGKYLRKRYKDFLPDKYSPNIVEANTSNLNRTKDSVQLVLAGLFPPVSEERWSNDFPLWNPIPFNINPAISSSLSCPLFIEAYKDVVASPPIQKFLRRNAKVFEYVNQYSGLNASTPVDILGFRDHIYSQEALGLDIPQWTRAVYPRKLNYITGYAWYTIGSTPELIRLNAGLLVKYILDNVNASIYDEIVPKGRKIYLYSAHDSTLSWLLNTFEIFNRLWIPYSSFLILELHEFENQHYIRFLYQDYRQRHPKVHYPRGHEYVPIDNVFEIANRVLDGDLYAC